MNKTYETICKLVSTAMFGSAISYEKDIDWDDIFEEMKVHGIAALVGDILPNIPMEDKVRERWKDYIFLQQIYWKRNITIQTDICNSIKGIPYAIVKGMSAAIYYPNPMLRSMGDIDVLLHSEDLETVRLIQRENGYVAYENGGVIVELHGKYTTPLNDGRNRLMESIIMGGVDHTIVKCLEEYYWNALPEFENGLSIIYHIYFHFHLGIGFRQIIDWMMFINRSQGIDWLEFNRIMKEDGLYKFQCAVTKVCCLYLGLEKTNEIKWADDADDNLATRLFDYIASRGNFGRKSLYKNLGDRFAINNKLIGIFSRLQLGGMHSWRAVQNHRILKPFAWIYQGVRVTKIVFGRKNIIRSLRNDIEESHKIVGLFDDLQIDRIDARSKKY